MFEVMKYNEWLKGYAKGMNETEELRKMEQQSDDNGITYATQGDYMKAKVAFNAKDTEISGLKEKLKKSEEKNGASDKGVNIYLDRLCGASRELQMFYLEAIGNAKTVKQVEAVVERYKGSEAYKASWFFPTRLFTDIAQGRKPSKASTQNIFNAATTKIKRINTKDAHQLCTMLDTTTNRTLYASSMATTLKGIANIEVDMTKVLAAKDSGLDAWNVLLSMLVAYGVKADNVLEVK